MIQYLALVLALPIAAGAAAILIARRFRAPSAGTIACFTFALALVMEIGIPTTPPPERWQRLPLFAAGIGIICLAPVAGSTKRAWILPLLAGIWTAIWLQMPGTTVAQQVCLGIGVLVLASLLAPLAGRGRTRSIPAAAALSIGGAGGLLLISGFATPLLACAATATVALVATVAPPKAAPTLGGAATAFASLLIGLVACGHAYDGGDIPLISWAIVATAPQALWLGEIPALRWFRDDGHKVTKVLLRLAPVAAVGTLVAIAVCLALLHQADDSEGGDPMEGNYGAVKAPHPTGQAAFLGLRR